MATITTFSTDEIRTWVDSFDYDDSIVNDVQRKYLAHYVNIGTDTNKEWEMLGYKVEDASVTFNWEDEPVTDITGATYNSVTRSQPEIDLEGYIVNKKSKFLKQMTSIGIRNAYDEFSNFEVLTAYYWLSKGTGSSKTYLAKREIDCTIRPESIGGEGYVRIAPKITLSNKHEFGSVAKQLDTDPTFTLMTPITD